MSEPLAGMNRNFSIMVEEDKRWFREHRRERNRHRVGMPGEWLYGQDMDRKIICVIGFRGEDDHLAHLRRTRGVDHGDRSGFVSAAWMPCTEPRMPEAVTVAGKG